MQGSIGPDHVSASRCRLRTDSAVTTVATQIVDGLFAMARSSTTSSQGQKSLAFSSATSSKFAAESLVSHGRSSVLFSLFSLSSAFDRHCTCKLLGNKKGCRSCHSQCMSCVLSFCSSIHPLQLTVQTIVCVPHGASNEVAAVASNTSSLTSELAAWVTARVVAGRVSTARRRSPHPPAQSPRSHRRPSCGSQRPCRP